MSDKKLKKLNEGFVPPKPSTPKESNTGKKGFNPPKAPKPTTGNQNNSNKNNRG